VKLPAPAKVNIGLRLLARRPDAYHELESFVHTLAWGDEVELERAGEVSLQVVTAPDAPYPQLLEAVPRDGANLAWRAAVAALGAAGMSGVAVRLIKRIPPGAGLGGGSSDAAAVLQGILALGRADLSDSAVNALAAGLGADVPFFLQGGCALVEGIGERVRRVPGLGGTPCVLLLHPFAVSTPRAYQAANYTLTRAPEYGQYLSSHGNLRAILDRETIDNDLLEAVAGAHPEIAASRAALIRAGAFHASMTGSGSAVYGLFDSVEDAHRAALEASAEGRAVVETELRQDARPQDRGSMHRQRWESEHQP